MRQVFVCVCVREVFVRSTVEVFVRVQMLSA